MSISSSGRWFVFYSSHVSRFSSHHVGVLGIDYEGGNHHVGCSGSSGRTNAALAEPNGDDA